MNDGGLATIGERTNGTETGPSGDASTRRRLRALMFVPQYPYPIAGGLERQALELSKALLAAGVEVEVVSGKTSPDQERFELVDGVPVTRIPWAKWKPWRFVRSPLDIARLIWAKRHSVDVVHLHQNSWASLFALLAAKAAGCPVLTKLPNVGEFGIPGMRRRFLGGLRVAILRLSNGIVAMSNESKAELLAIGFPEGRILTVPNGISLRSYVERVPHHRTDGCRVVYVGRLSEEKCLESLLTAWKQVVTGGAPSARLELWGDGPLQDALRRQCVQTDILNSVHFTGYVDRVRDRLREVDIFVLPSRFEGNSNAVLEAMEAGLPIVSTRVGGTPMQVGDDGAAWLIEAGDSDGLAEKLLLLLQKKEERRRAGVAMRQRVEQFFDMRNIASMYSAAYRCLAGYDDVPLAECGRLPEAGSSDVRVSR